MAFSQLMTGYKYLLNTNTNIPLVKVLAAMEKEGIRVDVDFLKSLIGIKKRGKTPFLA